MGKFIATDRNKPTLQEQKEYQEIQRMMQEQEQTQNNK